MVFKTFKCDLTLVLGDVTVHDFNFVFNLVRKQQLVRLVLRLSEHDSLSSAITNQDVSERVNSIVVRTVDDQVLHTLRSLVFEVAHEINHSETWLKEAGCDLLDPPRHRRRKHQALDVWRSILLDGSHDLLDFFFEPQVKHAVCFVQHSEAQN
jgi:hypothetical protein